ncbi:hypothetical protein [Bacteroides finegoldii]|uniref:hypothetical protein n=1 Tax=Bacteroides finegoldii TaxID=338188 RepID=UPI00265CD81C|nr:hypothetical protein [Bacteroides finegoldii]
MAKTSGGIRSSNTQAKVMTEEEYLASKGFGRQGFGDVALAKGNYRNRAGQAILERQNNKDIEYQKRRVELRAEYNMLVRSGKIREPSIVEKLLKAAKGSSENESVKAARRALTKRGIDWRKR